MYIIRYSEIGLKGKSSRRQMESRLVSNIKYALNTNGLSAEVKCVFGRIYVESDEDSIGNILSRIFGVKSYSKAKRFKLTEIEDIVETAYELFAEQVTGKTFSVRTRRIGDHSFKSMDVSRAIADKLYEKSSGVDLDNPQVEVYIEIRDNQVYYFTEKMKGPGGLPLATEGRYLALVSGGIDSPVAAWMMMKRGSPVDFLFISMADPIDTMEFYRAISILHNRWSYGYSSNTFICDFRPYIPELMNRKIIKYPNVTFKKIMYSIAEAVAIEHRYNGIITGESSGQVSSQTPENIKELSSGMTIPVLRPLIGFDKDEISDLARKIGTFPTSPMGEFCSLFAETPITRIKKEELDSDMQNVNFIEKAVSSIRVKKTARAIRILDEINIEDYDISGSELVIDLRNPVEYKNWHYGNSLNIPLPKAIDLIKSKDHPDKMIFYCSMGLQSAYLASLARDYGIRSKYYSAEKLRKIEETKKIIH